MNFWEIAIHVIEYLVFFFVNEIKLDFQRQHTGNENYVQVRVWDLKEIR